MDQISDRSYFPEQGLKSVLQFQPTQAIRTASFSVKTYESLKYFVTEYLWQALKYSDKGIHAGT